MSDSKSKDRHPGRQRGLNAPQPAPPAGDGEPPEDTEPVIAPVHLFDDYWQPRPAAPRPDVEVEPVPEPEAVPAPAPPEPVVESEPPPDRWARPSIPADSDDDADVTPRPFFDFYGA